jgi:hypothetical protein
MALELIKGGKQLVGESRFGITFRLKLLAERQFPSSLKKSKKEFNPLPL